MTLLTSCGVSLFDVLLVSSETESRQTVKLTLYHRNKIPKSVDIQTLIHRTEPNRPHISSDIAMSKSVETKKQIAPYTNGAPRLKYL